MISIIITAGGIGKRMGTKFPKQFLLLAGEPLIFHTIRRFYDFTPDAQILITLPENWKEFWEEQVETYGFDIPVELVNGGEQRYHSIKNALAKTVHNYVFVHDAVRPFVSKETLERCLETVTVHGSAVPTIRVNESLREKTSAGSKAVNRENYLIVQTPQCFERELLLRAYERDFHSGITDDASLVEESGVTIQTVEGNPENIKITTPIDLKFAELIFQLSKE